MKESPGRERWVREAASVVGLCVLSRSTVLSRGVPFVRIRRGPVADRRRHVKNKGGGNKSSGVKGSSISTCLFGMS